MEKDFKAAEFLFKKIKSIYPTFEYPDELDVDVWLDVLNGYSQTEILDALKAYRRNTEYNTAPTPANFEKWLVQQCKEHPVVDEDPKVKYFNPAVEFMQRDINLGRCTHTINAYNHAVAYILHERLVKELPMAVYAKMDFSQMVKEAKDKGLFDDFEEVLEALANKQQPAELPKGDENFGSVGAILAGHWGADD